MTLIWDKLYEKKGIHNTTHVMQIQLTHSFDRSFELAFTFELIRGAISKHTMTQAATVTLGPVCPDD